MDKEQHITSIHPYIQVNILYKLIKGNIVYDKKDGNGQMKFASGDKYEGEWR